MFFCDYQTPSLGRSGLHQGRQEAEFGLRALQGPGLEREGPSERWVLGSSSPLYRCIHCFPLHTSAHQKRPSTLEHSAAEGLAIFGPPWGRAGAELKIMAAIEAKLPGSDPWCVVLCCS